MNSSPTYNIALTLIAGPPGSGKTTLAKKLVKDKNWLLFDDPKVKPDFSEELVNVVTDPNLCYKKVFDTVNKNYPHANWIFFRPNCIRCWSNLQKRFEATQSKYISYKELMRFHNEYEVNFDYYTDSVELYKIEEIHYGLV